MATIDFYNSALNNAATQASNLGQFTNEEYNAYIRTLGPWLVESFNELAQGFLQKPDSVNVPEPPAFSASYHGPGNPPVAPDVKNIFDDAYLNADPVTMAALTAAMNAFLAAYAPDYTAAMTQLQSSVITGMTTGKAIEDSVEQAMYNMAAQRIESEGYGRVLESKNLLKKRGYELPQIYFNAIANAIAKEIADRLAQSATEVTVERAKLELQHKQFCMQLSSQIENFIMNSMVQFAQIVASLKEYALKFATAAADAAAKTYDVEVDLFKARIQAAVAELTGAVDANKATLEAYIAKVEAKLKQSEQQLEYQKLKLDASTTVFEADVKKKIVELEQEIVALGQGITALGHASSALGAVAQAAMSGVNAVASEHTEL